MGDVLLALWKGEVSRHVTMEAKFMDRQRQRVRTNKASKTTTLHADHAFPASGNFLTAPWILSIGEQISSFFFFSQVRSFRIQHQT